MFGGGRWRRGKKDTGYMEKRDDRLRNVFALTNEPKDIRVVSHGLEGS